MTIRTRTRGAQPPAQNQSQDTGWWQEGDEGFETAEKLNSGRKYQTSRFYLKVDEQADLILLDDGKGFFIHEYEIYDPARKRTSYETVRKDVEFDPLEQLVGVDTRFKDASYIMYLTCIDLRPFTDKNGNQRYFAKKLLPVKKVQMKKFKRWFEQYGTYRGLSITMTRDDPKGAKIGDPELNPRAGKVLIDEDDILENFGGPQVKSQDGKTVLKEENADCYAFDYRTVLAPATPEELAKRWGAPLNPGSSSHNQQMLNSPPARPASRPAAGPPPLLNKNKTAAPKTDTEETEETEKPQAGALKIKPRTSLVPKGDEATAPKTLVKKPEKEEDDNSIPFDTDEGETTDEWYEDADE